VTRKLSAMIVAAMMLCSASTALAQATLVYQGFGQGDRFDMSTGQIVAGDDDADFTLITNEGTNIGTEGTGIPGPMLLLLSQTSIDDIQTAQDLPAYQAAAPWVTNSWDFTHGTQGQEISVGQVWAVHTREGNLGAIEITQVNANGATSLTFKHKYFGTTSTAPVVSTTTVLPNTEDTVGPYGVTTTVDWKGVTEDPAGGIKLVWRVDNAAAWTRTQMNWTGCTAVCTYSSAIPGQAVGSEVEYYVEAINADSDTGSEPTSALATGFIFHVTHPAPVVSTTTVLPNTEDTVGPYGVTTTVDWNGATEDPAGGIKLVWRVDNAAAWTRTQMNWTGCTAVCTYSSAIPGQAAGSEVEYYVEAINAESGTGAEPASAPATGFIFHITQPAGGGNSQTLVYQGFGQGDHFDMSTGQITTAVADADFTLITNEGTNIGNEGTGTPGIPGPMLLLLSQTSIDDIQTAQDLPAYQAAAPWVTNSWEGTGTNGQPLSVGQVWAVHTREGNLGAIEITQVNPTGATSLALK
jgi:hypothetical protein